MTDFGKLGEARVEVVAKLDKYQRDLKAAQATTTRTSRLLNDSLRTVARTAGQVSSSIFNLRNAFIATAGAAASGLFIRSALDSAKAIGDLSKRANTTAERLQTLRFAASQNGASFRDIDDALTRLNRRIGLFITDGGGPAANALKKLGLENAALQGELSDSGIAFDAVVRALQGVESQAERAALASQVFGEDAGPRLVTLINQGVDGIERLEQKARDLGIVMSQDLVDNASVASDNLDTLFLVLKTKTTAAVAEYAQDINQIVDGLIEAIPRIAQAVQQFARLVGVVDTPVRERIGELQETISRLETSPTFRERFGILQPSARDQLALYRAELEELLDVAAEGFGVTGFRRSGLPGIGAPSAPPSEALGQTRSTPSGGTGGGSSRVSPDAGIIFGGAGDDAFGQGLQGAEDNLKDFTRATFDAQAAVAGLQESAISNLSNGLVNIAQNADNAKEAFTQMVVSFIADLARLAAQQALTAGLSAVFNAIAPGSGVAASAGAGATTAILGGRRALGGPVFPGTNYLVGERGPEVVRFGAPGQVVSNADMRSGGGGGGGAVFNIDARGADQAAVTRLEALVSSMQRNMQSNVEGIAANLRSRTRTLG